MDEHKEMTSIEMAKKILSFHPSICTLETNYKDNRWVRMTLVFMDEDESKIKELYKLAEQQMKTPPENQQ